MKSTLKEYVRQVIKEVYNYNEIENLKKQLDIIVSKYFYKYMAKPDENLYDIATREVVAKLLEMGYVSLPNKEDEGASRDVYHKQKDSYVIKVSKGFVPNIFATPPNKSEVDIGTGLHGLDASDIVPNILYYDTFYKDNPIWIIAEKVTPISNLSSQQLSVYFPTFFRLFGSSISDEIQFLLSAIFSQSVGTTPDDLQLYQMKVIDFTEVFCDIVEQEYPGADMSYLEKVRSGLVSVEDLKKIFVCMKYVQTSDLHEENIGVRGSSNPSPNDIVILDFDANY
jgi:hypothetical protein